RAINRRKEFCTAEPAGAALPRSAARPAPDAPTGRLPGRDRWRTCCRNRLAASAPSSARRPRRPRRLRTCCRNLLAASSPQSARSVRMAGGEPFTSLGAPPGLAAEVLVLDLQGVGCPAQPGGGRSHQAHVAIVLLQRQQPLQVALERAGDETQA